MGAQTKPKRAWLYLSEDDQRRLEKLVSAVATLSEVSILSTLAAAGLKACEDAGNRLPLPLKFQIVEGPPEKSNPVTKSRR